MKKLYQDITKSKLIRKKSRKNKSQKNKYKKNRTRYNRSRKNRTRNTKSKKNYKSIKNNKNKTKQFKNKKRGGGPDPLVANTAKYKILNDEHNIYVKVTDGINYNEFPGNGIIIPSYSEYLDLGNKPINLGTSGLSGCTAIAIEIHHEGKILLWLSHIMSNITQNDVNLILDRILDEINKHFTEEGEIIWTMFNTTGYYKTDNFQITLYALEPKKRDQGSDVLIKNELDKKIRNGNTKILQGNQFRFEVEYSSHKTYIPIYKRTGNSNESEIKLKINRLVNWGVGVWNYGTPNNTDE